MMSLQGVCINTQKRESPPPPKQNLNLVQTHLAHYPSWLSSCCHCGVWRKWTSIHSLGTSFPCWRPYWTFSCHGKHSYYLPIYLIKTWLINPLQQLRARRKWGTTYTWSSNAYIALNIWLERQKPRILHFISKICMNINITAKEYPICKNITIMRKSLLMDSAPLFKRIPSAKTWEEDGTPFFPSLNPKRPRHQSSRETND